MNRTLRVFPTSRSLRAYIAKQSNNTFLDDAITIAELYKKIFRSDGLISYENEKRIMLLHQAAEFKTFASLQIENRFFTFFSNASYIINFYEELSGEKVDINDLLECDTYSDYEEHLSILQTLLTRYKKLCKKERVIDSIFIKEDAQLDLSYLNSYKCVEITIDGYLTRFELDTLCTISKKKPLILYYASTPFNVKMTQRFIEYGLEVGSNAYNAIHIHSKETVLLDKKQIRPVIECEAFNDRIMQVAFIKRKVSQCIEQGIPPEEIVVVVPNESFVPYLRTFDTLHNYNYAMGTPFKESHFFKVFQAMMNYYEVQSVQNRERIVRLGIAEDENFFGYLPMVFSSVLFHSLIEMLLAKEENSDVTEKVKEESHHFLKLSHELQNDTLEHAIMLFLKRLSACSIDDKTGGKVTVLGVLETRALESRAVIVVDFNDTFVPHKSDKDMFLNSKVRHSAGLPTASDREALQKHFYYRLFHAAEYVYISYVKNETQLPSRLLAQLNIEAAKGVSDSSYRNFLYEIKSLNKKEEREIVEFFDSRAFTFSATALRIYLECKRKFYYRYIKKIQQHEVPQDMPKEWEIGNVLHQTLRALYTSCDVSSLSYEAFHHALKKELLRHTENNALHRYQSALWAKKLELFCRNEIIRFEKGYRFYKAEAACTEEYDGVSLSGVIDRLDITPEGALEVIDYKSGSYPLYTPKTVENATDFQLEFYALLAKKFGEVERCSFYDLNSGVLIEEVLFHEKMQRLHEVFAELKSEETVFEKCDDLKYCRYCEYVYMCGRG